MTSREEFRVLMNMNDDRQQSFGSLTVAEKSSPDRSYCACDNNKWQRPVGEFWLAIFKNKLKTLAMNKGKPKPKKVDKLASRKEDHNAAELQVLRCNHVKCSDYNCKENFWIIAHITLFSLPMPIKEKNLYVPWLWLISMTIIYSSCLKFSNCSQNTVVLLHYVTVSLNLHQKIYMYALQIW